MEEKPPWVTCYLIDMLLSYIQDELGSEKHIDYGALFRSTEGFETPSDPKLFLRDASNWVPLSVLRELELQCEKISGKKDIAYDAAKDYFTPGKRQLPSLFEIIVRVLNDVRSALLIANLWGSSQTNYLKLQTFESPSSPPKLYILSQFNKNAEPAVGALHLLRGFCEGFPRLYPFIEEVRCNEEVSQLRLEDIVREFPDFSVHLDGSFLIVHRRSSEKTVMRAAKVRLATELIDLPQEFQQNLPEAAIVVPSIVESKC